MPMQIPHVYPIGTPSQVWGDAERAQWRARYTTTTEVYPDSPNATPEQCIAAQVAAVSAAVEFVCTQGGTV